MGYRMGGGPLHIFTVLLNNGGKALIGKCFDSYLQKRERERGLIRIEQKVIQTGLRL